MEILERKAAITGIGQSDVGRRLERDPLELTLDACLAAIDDAGLDAPRHRRPRDLPGHVAPRPASAARASTEVQDALRLTSTGGRAGVETSGQLGSVMTACAAIAAGSHATCSASAACGSRARRARAGAGHRPGGGAAARCARAA